MAVSFAALLLSGGAFAQQVRWNDPGPLGAGQPATLELVFEDCAPEGDVELPRVPGLEVTGAPNESRQFTMLNFRSSSSTTLGYPVRATQRGRLQLPPFEVDTSEGRLRVAGLGLDIGEPRLGRGGPGLDDVIRARLRVEARSPFAGEVFPVELELEARGGAQVRRMATPRWQGPGIAAETFGERSVQPSREAGRSYRFATIAMAVQPGRLALPPAQIELELLTGRRSSLFFSELLPAQIESDAPELDVRPLPEPAPPGFSGAVGNFALESKLVPEAVHVGEPITWTLRLSGEGNWPAGIGLPPRALPQQLRVVQPKSERRFDEGELFQGSLSEDLVLIPTQAGAIELPPLHFAYFDPHEERYRELVIAPPVVQVLESAAPPDGNAVTAVPEAASPAAERAARDAAGASRMATAQSGDSALAIDNQLRRLPGANEAPQLPTPEPLAGRSRRLAPLAAGPARALTLAPLAALALAWLALALRRAAERDPRRAQREAHTDLERRIRDVELASSSATDCAQALLAWQQSARVALGASARGPGFPRAAAERATGLVATPEQALWAALWAESEALLYAGRELAPGWAARARSARVALRVPRFNPLHALQPRHLLARGAGELLVALIAVLGTTLAAGAARADTETGAAVTAGDEPGVDAAAAGDPLLEAYRAGDFERARAGFEQRAALDPRDWVARANLGLALGQLGRGHEALAHTLAAFLRAPRAEALRWNLRVFAAGAGAVDPALLPFAQGRGAARLARQASPAEWQLAQVAGSAAACLGAGLWLRRRFRAASPQPTARLAAALFAAGSALAGSSAVALASYGALADPAAALIVEAAELRSIPTEADDEALSRRLEAGSLVRVRGSFLGWRRVARENGEQGWLRMEQISPLHSPLPAPVAAPAALPSA